VERHEPVARRIVVNSGPEPLGRKGWQELQGPDPFVWARNANLGIAAAGAADVLLVNDDVQLLSETTSTLARICWEHPEIGVLSPQIYGGINNPQAKAECRIYGEWARSASPLLPFVCVFLPRYALDLVGPLDESFTGYGGDDEDWCLRARDAGLTLGITPLVKARHGFGGREYSSSFFRTMSVAERETSLRWSRDQVVRRRQLRAS
jgi:GT2 family glycosyltransferase